MARCGSALQERGCTRITLEWIEDIHSAHPKSHERQSEEFLSRYKQLNNATIEEFIVGLSNAGLEQLAGRLRAEFTGAPAPPSQGRKEQKTKLSSIATDYRSWSCSRPERPAKGAQTLRTGSKRAQ